MLEHELLAVSARIRLTESGIRYRYNGSHHLTNGVETIQALVAAQRRDKGFYAVALQDRAYFDKF